MYLLHELSCFFVSLYVGTQHEIPNEVKYVVVKSA